MSGHGTMLFLAAVLKIHILPSLAQRIGSVQLKDAAAAFRNECLQTLGGALLIVMIFKRLRWRIAKPLVHFWIHQEQCTGRIVKDKPRCCNRACTFLPLCIGANPLRDADVGDLGWSC